MGHSFIDILNIKGITDEIEIEVLFKSFAPIVELSSRTKALSRAEIIVLNLFLEEVARKRIDLRKEEPKDNQGSSSSADKQQIEEILQNLSEIRSARN